MSGLLAYAAWLRGQLKAYTIVEAHQENNQADPPDLWQHLLVQPMRDCFSRMKTKLLMVTCCCSCSCNRCQTADPEIPPGIPLQDLTPNQPPAPLGPVIASLDWPPTNQSISQAAPDPPAGLPMIIPAPDHSMMIPAPDSSVMVQVPGPQLTSVSVTMPSQRTLSRNNSFRRANDDQQLQSWMTETAQLLAKIQALNARREVLPPAASHDSLYENTEGDASLTFGLSEATGWQYRAAPPRPGNPSLPPLPPPPVRTSSLRLKGVAKTLANQKKKSGEPNKEWAYQWRSVTSVVQDFFFSNFCPMQILHNFLMTLITVAWQLLNDSSILIIAKQCLALIRRNNVWFWIKYLTKTFRDNFDLIVQIMRIRFFLKSVL